MAEHSARDFPDLGHSLMMFKAFIKHAPIVDEEWKTAGAKLLEILDHYIAAQEFIRPDPDPCGGTIILKYIEFPPPRKESI